MTLFEEEDVELKINHDFAKKYEEKKRKEELSQLEEKYGTLRDVDKKTRKRLGIEEEDESASESSEEEEDDDGELITAEMDAQILKTIAMIRKKDPVVYDPNLRIFNESAVEESEGKGEKAPKPVTLKEYQMQRLLQGDYLNEAEEEIKSTELTYNQEQDKMKTDLRNALKSLDEQVEDDEFLKPRTKSQGELHKEEDEYKHFLLNKLGKDGEFLFDFEKMKEHTQNENDKFLMDYILNKGWVDEGSRIPTYDEIVKAEEDEDEVEEMEDFELKHNFRYLENGSSLVTTHSREVVNSLRRKDDKRKQERERRKTKKEQEKKQKEEELKRLKNLKKAEIVEKLKKIQEIAGLSTSDDTVNIMGLETVNLEKVLEDEEFDPNSYDSKMNQVFGENYYENEDPNKKPVFDDDIDITDIVGHEEHKDADGDFIMDAEYDPNLAEKGKKNKKKKKKGAVDNDEIQESNSNFLEDYYQLNYEDIVGDIPTRFKYCSVPQNSYGLDATEILMADETDLNEFYSIKKMAPFRKAEKVERDEKKFKKTKKKKLWELKQKLAGKKSEEKKNVDESESVQVVESAKGLNEDRLASYGLAPKKKHKSKK